VNRESSAEVVSGRTTSSVLVHTRQQLIYSRAQGHEGPVTCVATQMGMWYIVSGGEDCTARLWHYDCHDRECYRLVTVLNHHKPTWLSKAPILTSVALPPHLASDDNCKGVPDPGVSPIVFSCTQLGDLFVWNTDVSHPRCTTHRPHENIEKVSAAGGISDLVCKREMSNTGRLLLATACGDEARLLEMCPIDKMALSLQVDCTLVDLCAPLLHDGPVLKVQHVPGDIDQGAVLATCSCACVHLWSLEGRRVMVLAEPKGYEITSFHLAQKHGGWLATGGAYKVSVWAMCDGLIVEGDSGLPIQRSQTEDVEKLKAISPVPLVQYSFNHQVMNVALDYNTEFIVVSLVNNTSIMISVRADPVGGPTAVGEAGPARWMVQEFKEKVVFVRQHGKIADMCVMEDMYSEPTLLLGENDRDVVCWDLQGIDAGEVVAELRSIKLIEQVLPMAMIIINFAQVTSFAFGSATSWNEKISRPAKMTHKMVVLDVEYAFTIDRELVFLGEMVAVIGGMILFVSCALLGVPEKLSMRRNKLLHGYEFKVESRDNKTFRPAHWKVLILDFIWWLVSQFMLLCATVLVVTFFRVCAKAIDCVHPGSGEPSHLADAPNVKCFMGPHLTVFFALVVLVPLYLFSLVPYAVCAGDVSYVEHGTLFNLKSWNANAQRKATVVDLGIVHPISDNVFITQVVVLVAKILLPCFAVLTSATPLLQMLLMTSVAAIMFIVSVVWPPLVSETWCAIVIGSKLMTLCTMLCGCLTVVVGKESPYSVYALLASIVFVLILTCRLVCKAGAQEIKRHAEELHRRGTQHLKT